MARNVLSGSSTSSGGSGGSVTMLGAPDNYATGTHPRVTHTYQQYPVIAGQLNATQFGLANVSCSGNNAYTGVTWGAIPFQINDTTGAITFGTAATSVADWTNNITTGCYGNSALSCVPGLMGFYGRIFSGNASYWYGTLGWAQLASNNTVSVNWVPGSPANSFDQNFPTPMDQGNAIDWGSHIGFPGSWSSSHFYIFTGSAGRVTTEWVQSGADTNTVQGTTARKQWRDTTGACSMGWITPASSHAPAEVLFHSNGTSKSSKGTANGETVNLICCPESDGVTGFKYKDSSKERHIFITPMGTWKSYDNNGTLQGQGTGSNGVSGAPVVTNPRGDYCESFNGEQLQCVGKNLFMYRTVEGQKWTEVINNAGDANIRWNIQSLGLTFYKLELDGEKPVFTNLGSIGDTGWAVVRSSLEQGMKPPATHYMLGGSQNQWLVKTMNYQVMTFDISEIIDLSEYATV